MQKFSCIVRDLCAHISLTAVLYYPSVLDGEVFVSILRSPLLKEVRKLFDIKVRILIFNFDSILYQEVVLK